MTKRTSSKRPDTPVFFTDRNLGPTDDCDTVRILRTAGMLVEAFEQHFDHKTPDHKWLKDIAQHGWIALSKDKKIMESELSVRATIDNGTHLVISIGDFSHPQLAENIIRARHKLAQWSDRNVGRGLITRLYMSPEAQPPRTKRASGEMKDFDHVSFLKRYK